MLGMPYLGLPYHSFRDLPRLFALVINRVELSIARSFISW
jgi:hypothetical protein